MNYRDDHQDDASDESGTLRNGPVEGVRGMEKDWDYLKPILDSALNVCLAYIDTDFNFIYVNEAYASNCGLRPEEMIGKNHFILYPDGENEAIFKRVRDTGVPAKYRDKPFTYPDQPQRGTTYWDWTLVPVRDGGGIIIGLVLSLIETTERKKAEDVVMQSEEMYRLLHDTMLQGVVFQDASGEIISMNPVAERILGKDPEDFIGSSSVGEERYCIREDGSTFPGEEHPAMVALRTGIRIRDVIMGVWNLRDGDYRWIDITAVPLFRPGELRPYQVYTVFEDITVRKRTERALRKSEGRYRHLFDSMAEAFELVEPVFKDGRLVDGKYQDVNPSWERMTGLNKREVVGKMARSIIGSADERWLEALDRALKTGLPVQIESYNTRLDRHFNSIVWRCSENACGVTTTDITESKKAEEDIWRKQAILEGINRIFREAISAESNEELGLACLKVAEILTNSRFGLIGHIQPPNGMEGIAGGMEWEAYSFTSPHRSERYPTNLKVHGIFGRVLTGGKAFYSNDPGAHPDYIELPDGHPRLTSFLGVPLTHLGKVIGMIGLGNKEDGYNDEDLRTVESLAPAIVEALHRKRAEEEKKRSAEELRRSNAELQQFAYVASHDLREPLRMVSSYLGLLDRYAGKELDAKSKEFMRYALEGSVRMRRMIDDLLLYSRIETQGKALEKVELEDVLAIVLKDLKGAIEESGASITNDPLPTVTVDRTQMVQVLQNLIGNAVKFRAEEAPQIHVSARLENDAWVISVQDNGIGIEPKHGDRLFLMFQRLHSQEEYEGTGIGLAIVKKIVEHHNGKIWFESEPGKGSTFYFTLPA
ncbi:MAG: PAS domain S-box protein [Methanomassiliicoccus sp.]|nr:PAS domain S-box protein [Methanomassiliicoccus sp.]